MFMKTNLLHKLDTDDISFHLASEIFTQKNYITHTKLLIQKSLRIDPTLVLHSDEDIGNRFTNSIVAIDENSSWIIGNSSLYPTTFPSLLELRNQSWDVIQIGETGSSVIDPHYRNQGIWKRLIMEAHERLWKRYDAIIGATVNTVMRDMRMNELGYEIAPFPSDLYEEWKIHLAPKMSGGIREFEEKAVCLIKFRILSVRDKILAALNY